MPHPRLLPFEQRLDALLQLAVVERRARVLTQVLGPRRDLEALDEEPSPILARRDRDERRRARREGRDGDEFGGDFDSGEE